MSECLCPKTTGLSLGILFAIIHGVAAIGISLGAMKYVEKLHFITIQHAVQPFSIWTFLTGLILAFMAGFIVGFIFTKLYNYFSCCQREVPKTRTKKARR